jgi:dephospho-CoA kinase
VLRVGLTGGIGAGKSAVARRLARRGAVVIDADVLAREVVAPGTDGLDQVVAAFGREVLRVDGTLDRPALGARVFGDDAARRRLEKVIHPRVRARSAELVAAAAPEAVIVNDVPLLIETGQAPSYHLVIVVEAGEVTRIRRLIEARGMTDEQARARIAAQAGDDQRRAAADVLLTNDGGLGELAAQVDALWDRRLLPYEENVRLRRPAPAPGEVVVAPDPSWPAQARRLMARIRYALGADADVAHVGPTAVPGMAAPDVIDLRLTVDRSAGSSAIGTGGAEAALAAVADALAAIGLPRCPEPAPGPVAGTGPVRVHGSADPARAVRLSVVLSP